MSKTSSAVVPRSTKMMLLLQMHDLVVTVIKMDHIDAGSTLLIANIMAAVWPIL